MGRLKSKIHDLLVALVSFPPLRKLASAYIRSWVKLLTAYVPQGHSLHFRGSIWTSSFLPFYSDIDLHVVVPSLSQGKRYKLIQKMLKLTCLSDLNYILYLPGEREKLIALNAFFFPEYPETGIHRIFKVVSLDIRNFFRRFPDYHLSGARHIRSFPKLLDREPAVKQGEFYPSYYALAEELVVKAPSLDAQLRGWLGEVEISVVGKARAELTNSYHFFQIANGYEAFLQTAKHITPVSNGAFFNRSIVLPRELCSLSYLFPKSYYDCVALMCQDGSCRLPKLFFQQYVRHVLEELTSSRSRKMSVIRLRHLVQKDFPFLRMLRENSTAYLDLSLLRQAYTRRPSDPIITSFETGNSEDLQACSEYIIQELMRWS